MRVLELSWEYPPVLVGGLGRHVHRLSEALAAQGVDVDVVTRGDGSGDRGGVAVHRVAQPPFPRDVTAFLGWVAGLNDALARRTREVVATRELDLVHSHDWLVADAARATAARAGVPWLVTVHATEHGRHEGRIGVEPQAEIHRRERAMARDADHLITCSEWMREHVADVFDVADERITVAPNGIELPDVGSAGPDAATRRAQLAPDGRHLVLLAGRLVYEKGFDLALEALAEIVATRDDVRFVVAGTGPAEAELHAQARRLGLRHAGRFLGWCDDPALGALYRAADVCVVPSRYEPFGIVALEAMASGCPPVVADTGGLREIVTDDVGLAFATGEVGALRDALMRILDDGALRAQLAARGPVHARRRGWPHVARATADVFERLLAPAAACA